VRLPFTSALSIALAATLLAACGGDDSAKAPLGSPENPLVAQPGPESASGRSNEAATDKGAPTADGPTATADGAKQTKPGYEGLVNNQKKSRPRSRFTPCNLVSKAEAGAIFGSATQDPREAAQGPTCIYRTESGKGFVTVAVQSVSFDEVRGALGQPREVQVSNRTAYCGQYGQAVLYVPLARGRVLSIAGPCPVATQFAAKAVPRLKG
jgi:hypothetical protein